jgi:hypothetical protein
MLLHEQFDLTHVEIGHRYRVWLKTILDNHLGSPKGQMLLRVLQDAAEGQRVEIRGLNEHAGRLYYSCARFVKRYHRWYTFTKSPSVVITCCHAYPRICGGRCCHHSADGDCQCHRLPTNAIHMGNCYDDCCHFVKIRCHRAFMLHWNVPHGWG